MRLANIVSASVAALALAAGSAQAVIITLDFEGTAAPFANPTGFGPGIDAPNTYYSGGTTLGGNGPGPNFGVQFASQSLTILDSDVPGGSGNFANEPTGQTVLFFLGDPGSVAVMNVPAGFDTGFATYYSSITTNGQITVWDGLNGTGNVLMNLFLFPLGNGAGGDPTGAYDTWQLTGGNFLGTARSVTFAGAPNFIAFDDVTFGSNIPAPGAALLALAGAGVVARRRRA
jgi:hypothetical protein